MILLGCYFTTKLSFAQQMDTTGVYFICFDCHFVNHCLPHHWPTRFCSCCCFVNFIWLTLFHFVLIMQLSWEFSSLLRHNSHRCRPELCPNACCVCALFSTQAVFCRITRSHFALIGKDKWFSRRHFFFVFSCCYNGELRTDGRQHRRYFISHKPKVCRNVNAWLKCPSVAKSTLASRH